MSDFVVACHVFGFRTVRISLLTRFLSVSFFEIRCSRSLLVFTPLLFFFRFFFFFFFFVLRFRCFIVFSFHPPSRPIVGGVY